MFSSYTVWAVIVARVGNGAKSRLATVLGHDDRRRLALAMLADVLAACRQLEGVVAVVDEPAAQALAERAGALVIEDPHPSEMNAAVARGVTAARQSGANTVIILPGDIPLVTAGDLEALVKAVGASARAVVVGASRDGDGTNALLLRPPDVITPAFGPPSAQRHIRAGLAAGATTRMEENLGLSHDVDTPADLAALADLPVAQHTAQVLEELLREADATSPFR